MPVFVIYFNLIQFTLSYRVTIKTLNVFDSDGTATNTGWKNDVIHNIEMTLKRSLQWIICIPVGIEKKGSLSIWIFFNNQDWNRKKKWIFPYPCQSISISFFNLKYPLSFWISIFLSFCIPRLSLPIISYPPPIHTNLFLSLSQSTVSPIFFNPYFPIHVYPWCNHFNIFLSLLKHITKSIHFNLYLSIHIYP